MCGIVGIFSDEAVADSLYDSLIHLQHRGQDAAGILTCQQRFYIKTGLGLVREIFNKDDIIALKGNMGIAHARYPTAGGYTLSDVQPIWLGSPRGIALAHNGNLVNYQELQNEFIAKKHCHLDSNSDSEVLLHLIAEGLTQDTTGFTDNFFLRLCQVVGHVFTKAKGSYSVVSTIMGKGMVAFRDPHGIRPLIIGEKPNKSGGKDYIFASETTMLYSLGFTPMGDVQNGEVVFVNLDGKLYRKKISHEKFTPCIFEYVYFARPDSTIDDVSVYRARLRMGENLAKRWQEQYPDMLPDVIIPAPFTANTAALAMARTLGVVYTEGLYKNPFIGRTFIMAKGKKRSQQVRYKLTPQRFEIQNKNVLIVDDSIVRGTTSREIVRMVREFDAAKVFFASAAPPLKKPCYYGIDIPDEQDLIAANFTEEQIQKFLNVDVLLYQRLDDLVEAVTRKGHHRIEEPCLACMNGLYITNKKTKKRENMNILIIGSGAREHAIAKSFAQSKRNPQIYCYGGNKNPGLLELAAYYYLGDIDDSNDIVTKALTWNIDLAIIGPESPLGNGLADLLTSKGINTIGPKKALARIETSKSYARELCEKYNIPGSPKYKSFTSLTGVRDFLEDLGNDNYVIKADGLMGGKGVKVAGDHLYSLDEAYQYCEALNAQSLPFVIEEKLIGEEFSLLCFTDGKTCIPMPIVQDNKRAFEGDKGPNTGGMGSYSHESHSLPFLNEDDIATALAINEKVISSLKLDCSAPYKGVLYGSFMKTASGIYSIEFNARFGDPEALNILPLLETDLIDICEAIIEERLQAEQISFKKQATVCKYAVPRGYPDNPKADVVIDIRHVQNHERIFYASVNEFNNKIIATGSRALAVVGIANTVCEAEKLSETEMKRIKGDIYHRSDIGKQAQINAGKIRFKRREEAV